MPRKSMLSAAALALLAGCAPGLPFMHHADPDAAAAVEQTQSLVQDCQGRFETWLGTTPVTRDTGPSITRTGEIVSIRLEAQPTAAEAIDPVQYNCDYVDGQLAAAGPVP